VTGELAVEQQLSLHAVVETRPDVLDELTVDGGMHVADDVFEIDVD
jgi:hypothetical protein